MELAELQKQALDQLKVDGKVLLKNQVAVLFGAGIDLGADEIKKLIPGQIDDAIIDSFEPQLKALAQAYVLALIEKI